MVLYFKRIIGGVHERQCFQVTPKYMGRMSLTPRSNHILTVITTRPIYLCESC